MNTTAPKETRVFENRLKRVLAEVDTELFELERDAQHSGLIDSGTLEFSIFGHSREARGLRVKIGIYFRELTAVCPCGGEAPEYTQGLCYRTLLIRDNNDALEILNDEADNA